MYETINISLFSLLLCELKQYLNLPQGDWCGDTTACLLVSALHIFTHLGIELSLVGY